MHRNTSHKKERAGRGRLRFLALITLIFMAVSGAGMMKPRQVLAACPCETNSCGCNLGVTFGLINPWTRAQFQQHRRWMDDVFFKQHLWPAMIYMTQELEAAGMMQMHMVGAMLDAKHLLETQRLYQELAAQAHKDYHPSEGLCAIGTAMENMHKTVRDADLMTTVMSQRSIDRQLLNANTVSAWGPASDRPARLRQFKEKFCDPNDNDAQLRGICATTVSHDRMNKDIDYTRTLGTPMTVNANLLDGTLSTDEEDLLALNANLFAHDVFQPIPEGKLNDNLPNQRFYLDLRSIVAKRSVAEHSFQSIAAMKSAGAGNGEYIAAILRELGMTQEDALRIVGANPSYYAQMEILTKKLLQSPEFILDLYDKPANVARKGVAIQALGLMQDRDNFHSTLRSESVISVLLELELMDAQREIQNKVNALK